MKIILAGATGFIGKALVKQLLGQGHQITLLTRNPSSHPFPGVSLEKWDGNHLEGWQASFENADAVINLAGAGIADKRWTPARKQEILNSRVWATRAISSAIQACKNPPKVLVTASAVGYYGHVPEGDVTESHQAGEGFLAKVCREWEAEIEELYNLSTRVVALRIGVVLEKNGGALAKMLPPFQLFIGGPLGSGRQWFPWIHREDLIRVILFCIKDKSVRGPVNAVSPNPVTMKDFCNALGKALHRPSCLPVPAFALKLLLGEMSEMLLTGQKAIPQKLLQAGFSFKHAKLDQALASLLSSPQK